jgi:hypothetical protein
MTEQDAVYSALLLQYAVLKKMWYLYTVTFHSTTKKNEILSFAGKWMQLENVVLSEVSQVQKAKSRMFSLICGM